MKQNFKLTKDQQTLVEKNLSIVHWVIVNNIHVNPGICGLEYACGSARPLLPTMPDRRSFQPTPKRLRKMDSSPTAEKSVVRGGTSVG